MNASFAAAPIVTTTAVLATVKPPVAVKVELTGALILQPANVATPATAGFGLTVQGTVAAPVVTVSVIERVSATIV